MVKVRAFGERFWVELQDILPGLDDPAFRARVDNNLVNDYLKVNEIIYISGAEIIDVYSDQPSGDKMKQLKGSISRLPSYAGLPRYHNWSVPH
jgi:hypothetical protein